MAAQIITSTLAGDIVTEDGVGYWLTACCGAAVTGVCEGSACKGCYRVVDSRLGFCWSWDDIAATSLLVDHVEALLDLDSTWAFKLVYGATVAAAKAVA
ncbi:hypothetical protein PBI_THONKO_5 [Mycobacterium phage Thonko]|uniref:Uncharacterized protein n=1 Tax=Mycobacterium phage Thonko TaxID=2282910 RepID=A0A346FC52_9CAUD|nr:hypothetical protein I5G57_gp005 [Mycobacterium phage Thonko]AXN53277.1 hypothetical protein PBI_THONKO_5 [Mycobacterium phage Thonko]